MSSSSTRYSWDGESFSRRANLLIDLDGTLTDPREGILACIRYALAGLEVKSPPDPILEQMIGPPLEESFTALLGRRDQRIGRAISLYRERFSSKGLYENVLYPGIRSALGQLREAGCALFVVTSKPTIFARRIVDHFDLSGFFHAVHGSELDGTNSAKSALIAHVLQRERLSAAESVMIGDRRQDISAAHACGLSSIGVLWGYGSREELIAAGAHVLCEAPLVLAEAVLAASRADDSISRSAPSSPVEGEEVKISD